ncbi:MAG: YcaO-like family protein [Deltaproteobacteria bacterium]|nr:YcaO-like family protein [Deltaproteobacteria bacterium]
MTYKLYRRATHRLRPPEQTLALIEPHLEAFGITRCADLTGLDRLGIPVCCAFNPNNAFLQSSWGKGGCLVDARTSALMEAVERFHATFPDARERVATLVDLRNEGHTVVAPGRLQRFDEMVYFSENVPICWLPMEVLAADADTAAVYVPAGVVYPREPLVNRFSANGLASGNCLEEAQLHALYEIIERDGISSCFNETGRLIIKHDGTRRIDLTRCDVETVRELYEKVQRAGLELVLLRPNSRVDGVHLFWAALIEVDAPVLWTRVNIGYGAHYSVEVAAVRAITEAAQSRLAYLHGCREDMGHKMRYPQADSVKKTVRYFASFVPEIPWNELEDHSHATLEQDWNSLAAATVEAEFNRIYRLRIPCRIKGISIVKLIVEGMRLRHGIF